MTTTLLGALAVLAAALVTATVTYIVARRAGSGTIATSTATDLWAASERITDDLQAVVAGLRAERTEQNKLVVDLRDQVGKLTIQVATLQHTLDLRSEHAGDRGGELR